jgi:polar amino acid transport system substrate-binding protein
MFKKLLIATLAFAPLLAASGVQAQALPEAIKSTGVINVGIERDHPPMEFIDPKTGELVGFDVDLINAIGAKLHQLSERRRSLFHT